MYCIERGFKPVAFLLVLVLLLSTTAFPGGSIAEAYAADEAGDISTIVQMVIDGIRDVDDTHAPAYYDNDWVLGMAAAGLTLTEEEKDRYLTWVLSELAKPETGIGAKAKTAIALTALNIDARQIPDKNTGDTINLINAVAYSTSAGIDATWTAPFLLSLYDLGNYPVPEDASITRESLIDLIMGGKDEWEMFGSDGIGIVMTALAPYYRSNVEVNGISATSCAAITSVIDATIDKLSSDMNENGGFPGWEGSLSSNTQAYVIMGLNALGINPHTSGKFYKSVSAMENLLAYQTADNKFGYSDNTATDDFSSKQGMGALATYQNLNSSRSSNLYHFTKEIAPYTSWPEADLMTSIKVTKPTKTVYSYDGAITQQAVDTAGMAVTGVYNGDATNTTGVSIESCTLSNIDLSVPGTQTVTVSHQGLTDTFLVTVRDNAGVIPATHTVSIRVESGGSTIASSNSMVIEKGKTSALDVLKRVLNDAGISYVIMGDRYVSVIDGLGEFDKGENSGWLYSINGHTPSATGAFEYYLDGNQRIEWYFTLDFTKDQSSAAWSDANAPAGDVMTIEAKVDAAGNVKATVTSKELQEAKAKGAGLTVSSEVVSIDFDPDALSDMAEQAFGDLSFTMTRADTERLSDGDKRLVGRRPVYEFIVKSGSKTISQFDGKVTVSLAYKASEGEDLNALFVYYLNSDEELELLRNCAYDEKAGEIRFAADHFSVYGVGYHPVVFDDTKGHWAGEDIHYLASRNIIKGVKIGNFAPDKMITRAEFVTILANKAGVDLSKSQTQAPNFADVKTGSWYANAVAWAASNKVTAGMTSHDGSLQFQPDANITRQDMAVMLNRYLSTVEKITLETQTQAKEFADSALIADYADQDVQALQQAGILSGKTNTSFAPGDNATRAEAARIIAGLMKNTLKRENSYETMSVK